VRFIRLQSNGQWSVDKEVVPPGTRWTVDTETMQRGWLCWIINSSDDSTLHDQVWAPAFDPPPDMPAPVGDNEYRKAYSFELVGEDGTRLNYIATTMGGLNATAELLNAIQWHHEHRGISDPMIELRADGYTHLTFGTVYMPFFCIVGWKPKL
jgi:hypothetical protein